MEHDYAPLAFHRYRIQYGCVTISIHGRGEKKGKRKVQYIGLCWNNSSSEILLAETLLFCKRYRILHRKCERRVAFLRIRSTIQYEVCITSPQVWCECPRAWELFCCEVVITRSRPASSPRIEMTSRPRLRPRRDGGLAIAKAGAPLVVMIVAGAYGLSIFMQTHMEYKDQK